MLAWFFHQENFSPAYHYGPAEESYHFFAKVLVRSVSMLFSFEGNIPIVIVRKFTIDERRTVLSTEELLNFLQHNLIKQRYIVMFQKASV